MKVKMLRDATWATHPALGNIEDFVEGQEVGAGYSDTFKIDLLNAGHAEVVDERPAKPAKADTPTPAPDKKQAPRNRGKGKGKG